MPPKTGPEVIVMDPVALLQEGLGIDEAQARDLANIQVVCPIPGQERAASLADFMKSEHGVNIGGQIVDIASQAQEKGATLDEAIAQALGVAAVRDTLTGKLARVQPEDSKKK